jgi:imidazolonepropionase-like amidohydrolase
VKDGKFAPGFFTRENVETALAKYAGYGVTTVMSLGMNEDLLFQIRDEQRAGKIGGAEVLTAGKGIGYQEGAPPFDLPSVQLQRVTSADEARAAVRATAERKADMVKLWTDTVFGKTKRMPPEILAAIVDESHRAKLKVAAHVFLLEDGKILLRDGLDVVAHSIRDSAVDEEFITLMKQKGAAYVPTLSLDETQFIYAEQPDWMQSPAFLAAADPTLIERWKSEKYAKQIAANPDTPKNRAAFAMAKQNLRALHDAGVLIGFGTDSGANPNRLPGWGEHRELQLYVDAGLTPLEAITCATRNAAEVLGLLEDRGTLEVGKRADFILLSADPLTDIRNTTKIAAIYQNGAPVPLAFSPGTQTIPNPR